MSPEYAMHGQYSMKSDVYSFGVLVFEIISGKRNSVVYQMDETSTTGNLVTNAWRLWKNQSPLELVDAVIGRKYQRNEVTRCIHIACVQDKPRRPSTVIILMLTLPKPRLPRFFRRVWHKLDQASDGFKSSQPTGRAVGCSVNDVTITEPSLKMEFKSE
ncbi:cysteine-rich receptor-like protein kinase 11 [Brassica rapa]|nr:cysteine-rich receptor-like protein kinase 11 [Brassica rapa]